MPIADARKLTTGAAAILARDGRLTPVGSLL
jgi:hypothetical protein